MCQFIPTSVFFHLTTYESKTEFPTCGTIANFAQFIFGRAMPRRHFESLENKANLLHTFSDILKKFLKLSETVRPQSFLSRKICQTRAIILALIMLPSIHLYIHGALIFFISLSQL